MATTPAYTDTQGRQITQTAYDSHVKAGKDVSGYKPITSPAVTPANVATTPVAPVAPVNTPAPVDQMAKIKALPQYSELLKKGYTEEQISKAVSGYKAPKATETAVSPTAEVKTETPATPVAQTTTEPAKITETQKPAELNKTGTMELLAQSEYEDNTSERMGSIVSNLNGYRQSTPQFMADQQSFRDNFAYEKRSDEQKKLLDNWYTGYQKGLELNGKNSSDLSSLYINGKISDSDMELLKLQNPNKYAEVMGLNDKNSTLAKYDAELNGTETLTPAQSIIDSANANTSMFDEYKKAMNTDEIKGIQTKMTDTEGEIKQLDLQINQLKSDVERRYEGTGATRSKINAIIADETSSLQELRNSKAIDYQTVSSKYTNLTTAAKDAFELQIKEQQFINEQKNQKMSELGFYYQYVPKGMEEMAETKYQIENPDIDSKDPVKARRALNTELANYYKQYGDIIIRPQSQALNDIITQAKKEGITLSQALKKNFTDPLQSKNLYSAKVAQNMGIDMGKYNLTQSKDGNWNISAKNTKDIVTVNGVSYYKDASGNLSNITIPVSRSDVRSTLSTIVSSSGGDLTSIATAIQNNYQDGIYGGQCGAFVNDIASSIGSSVHFGNTLKEKESKINSTQPSVGSFVVMDTGVAGGHVGMVTGVNSDGTVTIKDSNRGSNEKVQTHTLSKSQMAKVKGYVTPTVDTSKIGASNIDNLIKTDPSYKLANNILNGIGALPSKNDKNYNNVINAMGVISDSKINSTDDQNLKDLLNSSKYDKPVDATSIKQIQDIKTVLGGLSTLQGQLETMKKDVGPIEGLLRGKNPYDVNAQSIAAQVNALAPKVARGVFGEVGVLTDTDIARYLKTIPNQKMTSNVSKVVGDLLKVAVYKSFINTVTTNAQAGRNMTNFIPDYKLAKQNLESMGVSANVFDTTTPTAPKINNPFTSGFTIPAIGSVVASFYTPKQ